MKNEAQIEAWNGVQGERWVELQEGMDERIRVFGAAALAKAELRSGQRVLDVGCGCGDLALAAAQVVGAGGKVLGLDVSRPMLARATERARGQEHVEFLEHDAATIAVREPFDAVVSRFGVMFFDDPVAAFANLHAALKPGGRLAFVCWQPMPENAWAAVPLSAMLRVLPPPAPAAPGTPGPFAFSDPAYVTGILEQAGFSNITTDPFEHDVELGKDLDDALTFATKMGPSARMLRESDPEAVPRAIEMVRETLVPLAPSYRLGASTWLVSATA